jgi:hypothetical protein
VYFEAAVERYAQLDLLHEGYAASFLAGANNLVGGEAPASHDGHGRGEPPGMNRKGTGRGEPPGMNKRDTGRGDGASSSASCCAKELWCSGYV